MKGFISHLLSFAAFAVLFSGFTACTDTASSQRGPTDVTLPATSPDVPTNAETVKKKTDYPPIASAVATAEIKNLDGTTFTVNDKKGKILLLNLWATWCGPCRAEMPALVRMQEKHGAQGFEVLGLNTDDEEVEKINTFAASMKLNYPLAWADTGLQSSLLKISKFPGIPQSFLLDREGNLRGVFRGANQADIAKMEETVAKLVEESQ
ncbi:MAG: TlpA family protein disulfide reductase [Pyrinomonadaceae bacterium]